MVTNSTLRVRGLDARVGDKRLLDAIDLDVRSGEVTVVLGESGSGKTTLGLALLGGRRGAAEPSGSAVLDGIELLETSGNRPGLVGHLPQHPGAVLNPVRRIGGVLTELASSRHPKHDRSFAVNEALRRARLRPDAELLRRYPHQLSGGQHQRVALAQTLVSEPRVLVLDEPTTGLDTVTRAEMIATLTELARTGTAIVLLTHDLGLARQIGHRILVLRDGVVVERGDAGKVLVDPDHEHARELVEAEPRLPDEPVARQDSGPADDRCLSASGLGKKTVNGTPLLREVDLVVRRGRSIGIVGRSGAGKTTLGRCLAGLTRADSGRVSLDGKPLAPGIRRRTRAQRTAVQYIHQDARASFDAFRPVVNQLARSARLSRGMSKRTAGAEAFRVLATVGVDEADGARRPAGLSGGQLQRAAVARALLADPAVLICDEITSAQDMVNQSELIELLAWTARTARVSLVLISHDLPAIASLVDEICVLDAGRCVERAGTDELLSTARSAAGRELVEAARATAPVRPGDLA